MPGLSDIGHNIAEYAAPEDCGAGVQLVLNAVLAFNETLA